MVLRQLLFLIKGSRSLHPFSSPDWHIRSHMETQTAIVAATKDLQLKIQWASLALIYYDYFLTLPLEVAHFWRAKFKYSTLLYVFTRYAMVANVVYLFAISSKLSSCDFWYKVVGALSVLGPLGILGLACIILDCLHIPGLKCHGTLSSRAEANTLSILVCIFELVTLGLTTFRALRAMRGDILTGQSLTAFILRQGVLYFCGVFGFTLGTLIMGFLEKPDTFLIRVLDALNLPFSCLLTSRFLLHLRAFDANLTQMPFSLSNFSTMDLIREQFGEPILSCPGTVESELESAVEVIEHHHTLASVEKEKWQE